MPELGKVRTRVKRGRVRWYLDFSPDARGADRFLWGVMGSGFVSEADAETTRVFDRFLEIA